MKVLLVHSPYALAGGEERMVDTQERVLTQRGHDVVRHDGTDAGPLVARVRPDLVHVHNQFPALRPSVYAAAHSARVPVVQHLHNARLACVQPFLVRDGRACDDCVGRAPWPGALHRCYRDSATLSLAATALQVTYRRWWRRVDRFVAVSDALATTMRRSGAIGSDRLVVCHNGLATDVTPRASGLDAGYALYVGRLSYEKGVDLLLDAARAIDMRVVIAGDGPERDALTRAAPGNVEFLGHVARPELDDVIARARVVVAPSRGQEPFGLGVIEAAALGVPAVVTDVGGLPELVRDGATGVVVAPFDAAALAAGLQRFRDAGAAQALGAAARHAYEQRFTPDAFAGRLLAIYADVLGTYAP